MTHTEMLKRRVMRKVYFYCFLTKQAPIMIVQGAALVLIALGLHQVIAIRFVVKNALYGIHGIPSFVQFFESAFMHTGYINQLLFGASALLLILFVRDFRRAILRFSKMQANRAYSRVSL